jgi:chitin disaccharide deacetylase
MPSGERVNAIEKVAGHAVANAAAELNAIILNADDYGISAGVSAGIEELAFANRISAASALVTRPSWPRYAARLAGLRQRIAIGLHVNLTLGAPLGAMPDLAPSGTFPTINDLLIRCFCNRLDDDEIAEEISRQILRFEEAVGHSPDFIDGHQHVHILRGVRAGFLRALVASSLTGRLLVRDPYDSVLPILSRGGATGKALGLATFAIGFGANVRRAGFITNVGFAGVSAFEPTQPFAQEFERYFHRPGPRHLIMCHPGYPDAELKRLDPLVERRRDELVYLLEAPCLPEAIWHLRARDETGRPFWPKID